MASVCTNQCQYYYTLESPTSGGLGVECFQPPLGLSGELCVSSSSFSFPGSIQVPGQTCHRLIQTFYSCGMLLGGGSLDFHSSKHVVRCSSLVSHHEGLCYGCLGWTGAHRSAIAAFNALAVEKPVLCRQWFSSFFCQTVAGIPWESMTKVYQQCWKKNGPGGVLERVYQTMPFLLLSELIFSFTHLGLLHHFVFIVLIYLLY